MNDGPYTTRLAGTCADCGQIYPAGTDVERISMGVFAHWDGCPPAARPSEVCGSTGPRIGGQDERPRCGQLLDHAGLHRGFDGSGYEREQWGAPLMRDEDFAATYAPPTRMTSEDIAAAAKDAADCAHERAKTSGALGHSEGFCEACAAIYEAVMSIEVP